MDIDSVLKSHGIGIGGSNIKSIQRGVASVTKTGSNVTVNNVNMNNCLLMITVINSTNGSREICPRAKIVSNTSLNFILDSLSSTTTTVKWVLIEYNNIKSRQSGQISLSSTAPSSSVTVTISSANVAKSILYATFTSNYSYGDATDMELAYEITNNTTLTFQHINGLGNKSIEWQVIEFN